MGLVLALASAGTATAANPPATWTTGPKKILVIPVRFTDFAGPVDGLSPTGRPSGWGDMVNGNLPTQISAFMASQSYGKCTVEFTVLPEIDMGVSYTAYNAPLNSDSPSSKFTRFGEPGSFLDDARARARQAGIAAGTPALYDSDNYDLDIVGTGFIPGQGEYATSVTYGKGIYANLFTPLPHEIGHNLGLSHAQGVSRATYYAPLPRNTYFDDKYANIFDLMGYKDVRSSPLPPDRAVGAYWKYALGWLPDTNIITASTSGTYRIFPIDTGSLESGKQYGMRFVRDAYHTYWFEYRQAITGQDTRWLDSGLLVYFGAESYLSSAGNTIMIDTTPGSRGLRTAAYTTMHDAPLALGKTYSDYEAGLHVTPIRKGGTTPESLDVVVNIGPFPGNSAPTLAVSPATVTIGAGVPQTFTATASDPDGDTLAYSWEFDDPDQPAGVAFGGLNPDARLATQGSHAWTRAGVYLVRCSVTDMKGHRTIISSQVTVTGGATSMLTISGVVKDENGNLLAGAIVNNFSLLAAPVVNYDSTNFVASGETAADGKYRVQLPVVSGAQTYKLSVMHQGYAFKADIGTGSITVSGSSVSNVNFTRLRANRTITGSVAVAGRGYDPSTDGLLTISSGAQSVQLTPANPFWNMSIADGTLVNLTATPDNGTYGVTSFFFKPRLIVADDSLFYFAIGIPGKMPQTGFTSEGATSNDSVGTVNIPVPMTLPAGSTTWPAQQDFDYWIDPSGTAEYGVDFKAGGGQITYYGSKTPVPYQIPLKIIPTGQPKNKTVVIKMRYGSVIANPGPITTFTYTINNPDPQAAFHAYMDALYPGVSDPAIIGPNADPDGDGVPNLLEFALKGDPTSAKSSGLTTTLVQTLNGVSGKVFTYVIAFRQGAVFTPQPDGSQKNVTAVDGLHCTVQGSTSLTGFNQTVFHQGPSFTAPTTTNLPDLTGTGWEYHTFYLDPALGSPRGFLRALVDQNP